MTCCGAIRRAALISGNLFAALSGRSETMPQHSTNHLDPRAPLVLDTRDLARSPGSMRALNRVVPAPKDLGLELIGVPRGADLTLDLTMQSVSEGVYVSGTATAPLEGECGRCLRPIDDTLVVDIAELYAYENSTTDGNNRGRRSRTGSGRSHRPGAGSAGRGGARAAGQPACVARTAQDCAPNVGSRGMICRLTTAMSRPTRVGPL